MKINFFILLIPLFSIILAKQSSVFTGSSMPLDSYKDKFNNKDDDTPLLFGSVTNNMVNFQPIPSLPDYRTPTGLASLIYSQSMFHTPKSIFFQFAYVVDQVVMQQVLNQLDNIYDNYGFHGIYLIFDQVYFDSYYIGDFGDWVIEAIYKIAEIFNYDVSNCFAVLLTYPVETRVLTLTITAGKNVGVKLNAYEQTDLVNRFKDRFVYSVMDNIVEFTEELNLKLRPMSTKETIIYIIVGIIVLIVCVGIVILMCLFCPEAFFTCHSHGYQDPGKARTQKKGDFTSTTGYAY